MRSNVAPPPVLPSYKETRSNCPEHPDNWSGPTATIRGWGKMPKDVLRSDLTAAAKLVFAAIAAELYRRETVEMTRAEIGACCNVGERQVRRSLQVLVAKGLVEQRRLSVGRVYQYRLLHTEFAGQSNPQPPRYVHGHPSVCPSVRSAISNAGACTGPVFAVDARPRWIWRCRCARCAWNWGRTHRPSRLRSG